MTETYKPLKGRAIIIGNNNYNINKGVPPLKTAVNDANKLAEILQAKPHEFDVVVKNNLTKAEFLEFVDAQAETVTEEQRVLFYFAGHGIPSMDDEKQGGYLALIDADNQQHSSLLPMQEMYDKLLQFKCRHLLLILDCCFAGSFKWASKKRDILMPPKVIYRERFHAYENQAAWQVITSSSADQKAFDVFEPFGTRIIDPNSKHSPFAEGLFYGLEGNSDANSDGIITIFELYDCVRTRVDFLTLKVNENQRQTPMLFNIDDRHDNGLFFFLTDNFRYQNLQPKQNKNPYKGLETYNEEDRSLFYGRDKVIKELCKKIEEEPFVAIVGASGTGKSSVVKAGIIPYLKEQENYVLQTIRPGNEPLFRLEDAVQYLKNEKKSALIIDQFEEIVTQIDNETERHQFILKIIELIRKKTITKIIITIRLDFEPQFDKYDLKEWWNDKKGRFLITPLAPEEIREIIVQPAIQEILTFNPVTLVDKIVNEVLNATNVLPLLSYMLYQLYEKSINKENRTNELHKNDYDDLGGVIGALQTTADNQFNKLTPAEQETMKKVMLRMVSFKGGELAKRTVNADELIYPTDEENQRVQKILDLMTGEQVRLIVAASTEGIKTYEPLHDALITSWAKLSQWRNQENQKYKNIADMTGLRDKVNSAVLFYQENNNKNRLWHNDALLPIFEQKILKENDNWFNKREKEFIEKSVKLKKYIRNRTIAIVSMVIAIFAGLTIYAFNQTNLANQKTMEAKAQTDTARAEKTRAEQSLKQMQIAETNRLLQIADSYNNYGEYNLAINMCEKVVKTFPNMDDSVKVKVESKLDSIEIKIKTTKATDSQSFLQKIDSVKQKL